MFSAPSIWTMVHGIALSGGALIGLGAALFHLYTGGGRKTPDASRAFQRLIGITALALWAAVLVGTYVVFPAYRATPPEGTTDLTAYPREMILADAENAWLHSFGMEIKEHVPWIVAMLATAVAFVAGRYRERLLSDGRLRNAAFVLVAIAFALGSVTGLLGILINKFAPLE